MNAIYKNELLRYIPDFHGKEVMWITDPSQINMEHMTFVGGYPDEYCIFIDDLSDDEKKVNKVSFKTYFLKTNKRMKSAYDICQPSGLLGEEESALAQCFMAIAGFVRKMNGTSNVDAESMNKNVAKMVEEALKYSKVESINSSTSLAESD